MNDLVPEGWTRTPKPVSLSSQAIQDFSAGLSASTVRLVSVVLTSGDAFSGVLVHARTITPCIGIGNTIVNT